MARTAYVETCNKITQKEENSGTILSLTLCAFYFLINQYKQDKGSNSTSKDFSLKIFILSFSLNSIYKNQHNHQDSCSAVKEFSLHTI